MKLLICLFIGSIYLLFIGSFYLFIGSFYLFSATSLDAVLLLHNTYKRRYSKPTFQWMYGSAHSYTIWLQIRFEIIFTGNVYNTSTGTSSQKCCRLIIVTVMIMRKSWSILFSFGTMANLHFFLNCRLKLPDSSYGDMEGKMILH